MDDMISRQRAIDAICAVCGNDCDKSEFVYNAPQDEQVILCPEHYVLSMLPPVQLGTNLAEVGTGVPDINVGELISRQQAIDALHEYLDGKRCLDEGSAMASLIEHYVFDTLPTAQPEPQEECERCMMEHADEMEKLEAELAMAQPKRGRWISADAIFGREPFYCSECGENTWDTVMGKPRWNFCPNCGAKMEGADDE